MERRDQTVISKLNRIAAIVSFVLALSLPAAYYGTSSQFLSGLLKTEASAIAFNLSQLVVSAPEMWRFNENALDTVLTPQFSYRNVSDIRRVVAGIDGEVLASNGLTAPTPVLTQSTFVYDLDKPVARIEVSHSLRPIIWETVGMGLLGFLAGLGLFAIFRFLPARSIHQAWEDLSESEARFLGILENASDAIVSVDENQKITQFNKEAEWVFGYSAEEVLGQPHDLLLSDWRVVKKNIAEEVASSIGESDPDAGEPAAVYGKRKSGKRFPVDVAISSFQMKGQTISTALIRDLTGQLRAARELRESTSHLEISGEISKVITQNIEPDKLFRAIADRIKQEIPCDRFIISRVDPESGVSKYFHEDSKENFGPPSPEERKLANFAAEMFGKKAPVSIPDLLETQWRVHRVARAGYRSLLLVPVYLEDNYIAHFNLGSKKPGAFSSEQVQLLDAIAGHMGPAIQNSELYKESESRRENLEVVGKIAQAVSATLEPEEVFRRIADEVGKLIPSDRFSISSIDESLFRHSWYEVDNLNLGEYKRSHNSSVERKVHDEVYVKQKSLLNENVENTPKRLTDAGVKSRLISPIIQDGKVIAHISLSRRQEKSFSVEDQELLLEIAPHLGPAITNARLFEEAQRNRDFFKSVMDDNADAMMVTDSNQKIIQWNAAAETMYGFSKEEIIGQTFEVMLTEEAKTDRQFGMEMRATGRPVHFDSYRRRKNGLNFPVNIALSPIKDGSGNIVATCSIHKDLTESRRAERELREAQEEAMESARLKSEFLANMSHEIRTPMNGVLGMTGLLLDTNLTEQQRRYGNTILHSSESLLTLLNDILDFSKIEAGQLVIEPVNFDLLQTVESVMDVFSTRAYEKNIELIMRYPPDIPHRFIGDQGRVRQILNNLIGNAVKFTDTGHVLLEIEKVSQADGNMNLRFSVQDTGVGIATSKLEHIFDKFTQADTSTTRMYGGTGLGLSICKQLSEMMGGGIGVISSLGNGSKFLVNLPFPIDTQAPAEAERKANLADVRVLIVDDNDIGRQVIHELITSFKMRNGSYSSGESALRALHEAKESGDPFQIAILDQRMPGMDGLTLARHIKSDPAIRGTVLVILSSEDISPNEMADMEIATFLKKPVRPSELLDVLAKAWGMPSPRIEADSIISGGKIETRINRGSPSRERELSVFSARLLVVEDNQVNQMVAKEILKKFGCRVDIASDGKEALDLMEVLPYDAVLMDCLMPVMDGFETTRHIRENEKKSGSRIPIIAMTANAMKGDREMCLEVGMDDYVSKPVNPDELLNVLSRWVEKRFTPGADSESAPAPPAPSSEILDLEHLRSMAKLGEASGEDILNKLIEKFFSDTPQRLSSLQEILAKGNASAIEQQAHSLKGSSSNLGSRRMAEICERLEQCAREGQIEEAEEMLAELEKEYQRTKEVLASKPWMES